MEIDQIGEVLDTSDDLNSIPDSDPVIQAIQNAQDVMNASWSPSLKYSVRGNLY